MTKINQPRYKCIFRDNLARSELAIQIWKEVIEALKEAGSVTVANLARADRYVRTRVEFEDLYPIAAEEGPVKAGPNGGDVFNFNWSACEKLNDRLLKLEKAMFGEATAKETNTKEKGPFRAKRRVPWTEPRLTPVGLYLEKSLPVVSSRQLVSAILTI